MSFIKSTYQEKKYKEIDEKIKKIFSIPTGTHYKIKKDLENYNKKLKKRFFSSLVVLFFLSITLIWQLFTP